MKKQMMTLFIVFSFLFFFKMDASANELVNIVSGLDKSYEVTFDTYRVISGQAKKDTQVAIKHYTYDNVGNLILNKVSIKNVGVSEMFAEILNLEIGTNTIKITATLNENIQNIEYTLNKKDEKIKAKLSEIGNIFNLSIK